MLEITAEQKAIIRQAAFKAYDLRIEACGLIAGGEAIACENSAKAEGLNPRDAFAIAPKHLARRDIQAIWHSHNNGKCQFSPADVLACRKSQIPFVLHDVVNDRWLTADPSYDAPIEGQDFVYGINDCYSLVCRWYWQKKGIRLHDYPRSNLYDDAGNYVFRAEGWDEFRKNLNAEGAEELSLREYLQEGDVLLMQLGGSYGANHLGVIIDPKEEIFLHHCLGKISGKERWDSYWRENTVAILRKK
jgi:proteasome lid subunit RPN8/RPN11